MLTPLALRPVHRVERPPKHPAVVLKRNASVAGRFAANLADKPRLQAAAPAHLLRLVLRDPPRLPLADGAGARVRIVLGRRSLAALLLAGGNVRMHDEAYAKRRHPGFRGAVLSESKSGGA